MKCDICKEREAVVFVHQSQRGTKTEIRLCAVCAKKRGVARLDGDVSASLSKLLSAVDSARKAEAEQPAPNRSCPQCGSPMVEVRKRGLAGCASCWLILAETGALGDEKTFRPHSGRLPARVAAQREAKEDLTRLKVLLDEAIRAEDYETAARCRDRLRDLETGGEARA